MADVLATVYLRHGAIVLLPGYRWQAGKGDTALEAKIANLYSAFYEYSPAHGRPGVRLASIIAKKLKGKVELPPVEQKAEPGTVY